VDEAIAAEVEAARLEDRVSEAQALVISIRAELRRWIGEAADTAELAVEHDVSGVVMSPMALPTVILNALIRELQSLSMHVHLTTGIAGIDARRLRSLPLSYEPLLYVNPPGSAAPFIGLFGTVWGIMTSFIGLAGSQGVPTLQAVAPGIAEALVATAIGLAAAIPAVIAYNYFISRVKRIDIEMENFSSEFLNIVDRYIKKV
jgi:hypothetical protein